MKKLIFLIITFSTFSCFNPSNNKIIISPGLKYDYSVSEYFKINKDVVFAMFPDLKTQSFDTLKILNEFFCCLNSNSRIYEYQNVDLFHIGEFVNVSNKIILLQSKSFPYNPIFILQINTIN